MVFRQGFENIDGGRYGAALAVFHRFGEVHAVEENVTKLLGRTDVEFASGDIANLFGFDGDLALEFGGHFRKRGGIDFYSGVLHAGEDGDERQIDFFVELDKACLFDLCAQRGGKAAGDVGGFGQVVVGLDLAEPEIEARS